MKVAIRQDDDAGLIRAYFSSLDDRERVEVATLSVALARACPGTLDAWKEMLRAAMEHALRETGHTPLGFVEVRPHEMQ
jgi:hypothetical protein